MVGTGLAGASAAASLGEMGFHVLNFCIQDSPRRAHSIAAQGGINAAKNYQNDGDSVYRLFYDTVKGDFDYFTYCGKEVGKEIGDDALFTVGLQNYHFKNIESFFNISYDTICKLQKPRSVATSCQDILMEYFREHEMLDAAVDGRMTILAPDGTAR